MGYINTIVLLLLIVKSLQVKQAVSSQRLDETLINNLWSLDIQFDMIF